MSQPCLRHSLFKYRYIYFLRKKRALKQNFQKLDKKISSGRYDNNYSHIFALTCYYAKALQEFLPTPGTMKDEVCSFGAAVEVVTAGVNSVRLLS